MLRINLLLALAWAALTGSFVPANLLFGFALGYVLLWVGQAWTGHSAYFRRTQRAMAFAGYFLWQLVLANLRVAYEVMTPTHRMRPGVLAIPLTLRSDEAITLLANLLTLTPGSLTLDVSDDRSTLYVHVMHIDDPEQARRAIQDGYERRVKEVLS